MKQKRAPARVEPAAGALLAESPAGALEDAPAGAEGEAADAKTKPKRKRGCSRAEAAGSHGADAVAG
eukprot:12671202-Alexandrium_andersonii.AAC.1